jgi:hypothetical protein
MTPPHTPPVPTTAGRQACHDPFAGRPRLNGRPLGYGLEPLETFWGIRVTASTPLGGGTNSET